MGVRAQQAMMGQSLTRITRVGADGSRDRRRDRADGVAVQPGRFGTKFG